MERPHEYAPIEWIELTKDKIPIIIQRIIGTEDFLLKQNNEKGEL